MIKALIQKYRRKAVNLVVGKEMTTQIEHIKAFQDSVNVLHHKLIELENRSYKHEELVVKYMHPDKYEEWLSDKFFEYYGKPLSFSEPKTFNEKMQWIKLYGADELQTELADKYLVKDYIKNTLGSKYVVPLLGVYDNFDDINFDELPNQFVLKTNNASKSNIIVKDKADFDKNEAKLKITNWLSQSQFTYGLEMHYKNIKPKILIEEYLYFRDGIEDYKFYCFNNKPEYLLVIADRMMEEKMAFYDMEFKKQNFSILPGMKDLNINKPKQFDKMLKLTRKLANELKYPFVRIDWYIDQKGDIYFGEFTFNPGAGWYFFEPKKYDLIWGDLITLPKTRNEIP